MNEESIKKLLGEKKEVVVKKTGELWKKIAKYVYIGVGVLALVGGLVYLGQWYAAGKADELAKSLHEKFKQENQPMYEDIVRNRIKIEELETNYKNQSARIERIRKEQERRIDNVIQSGDTKAIASLFDNIVDGYTPPASFGK